MVLYILYKSSFATAVCVSSWRCAMDQSGDHGQSIFCGSLMLQGDFTELNNAGFFATLDSTDQTNCMMCTLH